ncbi:MAG: methylenetetrahydrofolate reductase [NAD(P)H] [Verrucomicrobiota bacterium]|nr:methylenetetrahydrofolate reductase [NAD(P)H] [Limisphaera sp.]MDW8381132.1 methylenetetrahydrofolate reductase [NAD(P)H] [Verrucomicrobiota bacterium]
MASTVLIRDVLKQSRARQQPVISFEFFPPKSEDGERAFFDEVLPQLVALKPHFCSVTYGAGGSTRDKTLAIVERIQRQHGLPAMAHLTCVGSSVAQLRQIVQQAEQKGILNILALRGDPPMGTGGFAPMPDGFRHAWQLVRLLREMGDFSIGVAGFPEGHPECPGGKRADWDFLIQKIRAGADLVITQLFFDNADFWEFWEYLTQHGVQVPVIPGILPILGLQQVLKLTRLCQARIPSSLQRRLEELAGDEEGSIEFGIEYATRQCEELLRNGVPALHFYTLNRVRSTRQILTNLRLI